jgi:hypothetical protein
MLAVGADAFQCRDPFRADRERDARSRAARAVESWADPAIPGTPVSFADRNTRAVFGEYIDVYDLTRAVDDGATVLVHYEPRLIPVDLPKGVDPELIDERADELTTGLDDAERERIQQAVTVMNELYGAPDRVRKLAADLVAHWEARSAEMRKFIDCPGKGIIVRPDHRRTGCDGQGGLGRRESRRRFLGAKTVIDGL